MSAGEIMMVACTVAGIFVYIGILGRAVMNFIKWVHDRFYTDYDENHS